MNWTVTDLRGRLWIIVPAALSLSFFFLISKKPSPWSNESCCQCGGEGCMRWYTSVKRDAWACWLCKERNMVASHVCVVVSEEEKSCRKGKKRGRDEWQITNLSSGNSLSSYLSWHITQLISMLPPIDERRQTAPCRMWRQMKRLNSSPRLRRRPNIYQTFITARTFASAQDLQSIPRFVMGVKQLEGYQ